jgi:small subunit ribosomal protein S1
MFPAEEHRDDNPVDEFPGIDEGWWSSVLADERYYVEHRGLAGNKLNAPSPNKEIDWEYVVELFEKEKILDLEVTGYNRGGLLVSCDQIQGFIPISHLVGVASSMNEEAREKVLKKYVGANLRGKVIECNPTSDRVVFSERAAQAREGRRKELLQTIEIGQKVHGVVTNITEFGVFIDLGGVEGLIHVSELSWGRVSHPASIIRVGEECDAVILQVSEEQARVALSLKRLYPNPWEAAAEKYRVGQVLDAWITCPVKYGFFAKLEDGIEGLIHNSAMSLPMDKRLSGEILTPGRKIRVQILHIDVEKRRLGLSLVSVE